MASTTHNRGVKLNQPRIALVPLKKVLGIEPDNQRAQLELADAYLSLGNPEQAAIMYKKLSDSDPTNAKAWQGLGLTYAALLQLSFRHIEKSDPESPYRDEPLGQSLLSRGQYKTAFYWYHKALVKDRSLPGAHAALAEIYRASGHPDWASIEEDREKDQPKPDCQKETLECDFLAERISGVLALASREHSTTSNYWLARSYEDLSLRAFRHLSALPSSPEVHELLAQANMENRNYHQAVSEWDEALLLAPEDMSLKYGLARALWLDNNYTAAKSLLSALVQADPDSAEIQFELGDILLSQGSADQAIPRLETAVKLDPSLATAQASLGRAYLRVHRTKEAIPHLKAALPSDEKGTTLYQLALAYKQTGQTAQADEAMSKFQRTTGAALARTQKMDMEHEITAP